MNQEVNIVANQYAIVLIGNIYQNPDVWGRPHLYDRVANHIDFLVKKGLMTVIYRNLLLPKTTFQSAKSSSSSTRGTLVEWQLELQFNSLVTLTHLIGFNLVAQFVEKAGGEETIFHPLLSSQYSGMRDYAIKAIRFYRTLQNNGDHMGDMLMIHRSSRLFPQQEQQLKQQPKRQQLESQPSLALQYDIDRTPKKQPTTKRKESGVTSSVAEQKKQSAQSTKLMSPSERKQREEAMLLLEEYKKLHNMSDKEAYDALSSVLSGLFGAVAFVWDDHPDITTKGKKEKKKSIAKERDATRQRTSANQKTATNASSAESQTSKQRASKLPNLDEFEGMSLVSEKKRGKRGKRAKRSQQQQQQQKQRAQKQKQEQQQQTQQQQSSRVQELSDDDDSGSGDEMHIQAQPVEVVLGRVEVQGNRVVELVDSEDEFELDEPVDRRQVTVIDISADEQQGFTNTETDSEQEKGEEEEEEVEEFDDDDEEEQDDSDGELAKYKQFVKYFSQGMAEMCEAIGWTSHTTSM